MDRSTHLATFWVSHILWHSFRNMSIPNSLVALIISDGIPFEPQALLFSSLLMTHITSLRISSLRIYTALLYLSGYIVFLFWAFISSSVYKFSQYFFQAFKTFSISVSFPPLLFSMYLEFGVKFLVLFILSNRSLVWLVHIVQCRDRYSTGSYLYLFCSCSEFLG